MPLSVPGKWIWDFWFAKDGSDYHVFYLQADRSLEHERLRHWNVSIGHAVSSDLRSWRILPDALQPSNTDGEWDDYTTWTGSVIQHEGLWYLFYTGSKREEKGLIQRVGFATSDDLITWHKHADNPCIEADPQWYELLNLDAWHDQAWRDPYLVHDTQAGVFHAFITARVKDGSPDGRGVIGHATSEDLASWTVKPPITAPGEFGHLEVPQIVQIEGRYYLVFCCPYENASLERQNRTANNPQSGTFYMMADSLLGPYRWETEGCLHADQHGTLYSGKLIQGRDNRWYFMAFKNFDADDHFIGELIDPIPVTVTDDGRLVLNIPSERKGL